MRRVETTERANLEARAKELGFTFHAENGERYWDERAYFVFSLYEIEERLEAPTKAIEALCLAFVDRAIKDDAILRRLGIPQSHWDYVARSWRNQERNLYGRLDLAYDGLKPAKLLEYNADTPTALYEAAVFQWVWLEDAAKAGLVPGGADQFNSIHERLVAAFGQIMPGARSIHFANVRESVEDQGTVDYLADCARQAGLRVRHLFMDEIGLGDDGRLADQDDNAIELIFKLYPWEWIFRDPFGAALPKAPTRFIEPPWKAILSNKAMLAYLWDMDRGNPNLLPCYFDGDPRIGELDGTLVRKPIYSREGSNIEILRAGRRVDAEAGPYGAEGFVVQQAVDVPHFGGGYVVLGSWLVASEPCGIGIRESDGPITNNASRFVPHVILD